MDSHLPCEGRAVQSLLKLGSQDFYFRRGGVAHENSPDRNRDLRDTAWLNTGSYLVLAGLAIVRRSSLLRLLHALSPSGAGPEAIHTAMGDLLPLYYGIMAGVTFAMAIGFWKLWNWVRVMMLGIIALSLVPMVTEVRLLFDAPATGAISLTLVRVVLSVLWLWYLLRRPVRDAFHRLPAKAAAA